MWQINASVGGVKAYFSWSVENPSSALNDYSFETDQAGQFTIFVPPDKSARQVDGSATLYASMKGAEQDDNSQLQLTYTGRAQALLAYGRLAAILASVAIFASVV